MQRLISAATVLVFACGPAQTPVEKPEQKKKGIGSKKDDGETVSVADAALPFKILKARGGTEVDEAQFWTEVKGAAAVCVGENHKNPHHHWAQLHIFDQLTTYNAAQNRMTALGMEMFQRPFQGVIEDYLAGKIDEDAMLSRTGYMDRWGFDWGFYSPMVAMAKERKAAVLALNTERELTKRVSRNGIDALTDAERAKLPELKLDDPVHRAWWNAIMGGMSHPTEEGKQDRSEWIYAAQVLWDETMADGAVKWLRAGANRQVMIVAGNGHCHDSAIVGRVKRRGIATTISVRPIIDKGDGELAAVLASPENDYLFVMTLPQ